MAEATEHTQEEDASEISLDSNTSDSEPEEVEVRLKHAKNKSEVTVRVLASSTIYEVKAEAAKELNNMEVLSAGRAVFKDEDGHFTSYSDNMELGIKRKLLFLGADLIPLPGFLPRANSGLPSRVQSQRSLQSSSSAASLSGSSLGALTEGGDGPSQQKTFAVGSLHERINKLTDTFEKHLIKVEIERDGTPLKDIADEVSKADGSPGTQSRAVELLRKRVARLTSESWEGSATRREMRSSTITSAQVTAAKVGETMRRSARSMTAPALLGMTAAVAADASSTPERPTSPDMPKKSVSFREDADDSCASSTPERPTSPDMPKKSVSFREDADDSCKVGLEQTQLDALSISAVEERRAQERRLDEIFGGSPLNSEDEVSLSSKQSSQVSVKRQATEQVLDSIFGAGATQSSISSGDTERSKHTLGSKSQHPWQASDLIEQTVKLQRQLSRTQKKQEEDSSLVSSTSSPLHRGNAGERSRLLRGGAAPSQQRVATPLNRKGITVYRLDNVDEAKHGSPSSSPPSAVDLIRGFMPGSPSGCRPPTPKNAPKPHMVNVVHIDDSSFIVQLKVTRDFTIGKVRQMLAETLGAGDEVKMVMRCGNMVVNHVADEKVESKTRFCFTGVEPSRKASLAP